MEKTEWINGVLDAYCAESGDLPRSTSHLSPLEEWLLKKLWENHRALLRAESGGGGILSHEEVADLLQRTKNEFVVKSQFDFSVGFMTLLERTYPDAYKAATQAGFHYSMAPAMVDLLCRFLKGEIDLTGNPDADLT